MPCAGKSSGAPSAAAATGSATTGSGSISTVTCLGGVDRLRQGLGEHHRDRLADEAHPVGGQQRPPQRLLTRERTLVGKVEVGRGPDRVHPVALRRGGGVHRADEAVGHVGPDEHRVQCALDLEVGHEPGAAGEQAGVLRAQDRMAQDGARHCRLTLTSGTLTSAIRFAVQVPGLEAGPLREAPGRKPWLPSALTSATST